MQKHTQSRVIVQAHFKSFYAAPNTSFTVAVILAAVHRTSCRFHAPAALYPPKPLIPILSGLLTFESDWSPPLGPAFEKALLAGQDDWIFLRDELGSYNFLRESEPATALPFKLISHLQISGTVPGLILTPMEKKLAK
jgi:hypothetical protein